MPVGDELIVEEIKKQISARKSVAPRDVAQALAGDSDEWRKLLPRIKSAAVKLFDAGDLVFLRKSKPVGPVGLKGVYRLAAPQADDGPSEQGGRVE